MRRLAVRPHPGLLLPALLLAGPAAAPAQQGGQAPPGLDREAMWYAPTAEDWAKPCLIEWQRTWDDAIAVSKETGKAILVCVNMDGEIASEHYAGVRYRQPDIAQLYEPYVCVIASVYRHTPRDYDENGQRVECPRFGTVTCGEHIWIEPVLFGKYFEGTRVSPRHIMVELDQSEVYDVYYAWDTDSVFQTIEDGITQREYQPPEPPRGDRSLLDKVASRDAQDRAEVEQAYTGGDPGTKKALLEAALALGGEAPVDLLRLAVYGYDLELSEMARRALAQSNQPGAVPLISEALRVPLAQAEREGLIGALERLGKEDPKARKLAGVHRGLGRRSDTVDVEGWAAGLAELEAADLAVDWDTLKTQLDYADAQARGGAAGPEAKLEAAEAYLAYAVDPNTAASLAADRRNGAKYSRLMFEDARNAALEAESLGAEGWRVQAVLALAAHYLGEADEAERRAEATVATLPAGESSWNAVATLSLFAGARQRAITEKVQAKEDFPPEWLTDVHAAYSVIARHPLCTETQVAEHHDFLLTLEAFGPAAEVLGQGLGRFPDSWALHARLRSQLLRDRGVAGLEKTYEEMLARPDAHAYLEWFAGYASLVTAEFHRRNNMDAEALAAYDRAVAHWERGVTTSPETRETADTYIALCEAGRARLAMTAGELERALAELRSSFARQPQGAATRDGLNLSAVDTARSLLQRCRDAQREDLAEAVQAELARLREIDPQLLEAPEWDRGGRPSPDAQRGRGRRGGR
jgi:hypothetical protein